MFRICASPQHDGDHRGKPGTQVIIVSCPREGLVQVNHECWQNVLFTEGLVRSHTLLTNTPNDVPCFWREGSDTTPCFPVFKLPWREAGPPYHLDDEVDLDQ